MIARNSDRIRIAEEHVLSDDWYVLRKTTFDYLRRDGTWQRQSRETYDRGNGASILLYNRARRAVILTRQFRFPSYVNGQHDGMLIETCAGLLDLDDPVACIRREAEEETGYRVRDVQEVFDAFMSPGSVTERLHLFVASYEPHDKVAEGGGDETEGEEIEVLELAFEDALAMMARGRDPRWQDHHPLAVCRAEPPARLAKRSSTLRRAAWHSSSRISTQPREAGRSQA